MPNLKQYERYKRKFKNETRSLLVSCNDIVGCVRVCDMKYT